MSEHDERAALEARLHALDELAAREAGSKLHAFMRYVWSAVEPARAFKDNWHIGAVCEHLQAVADGQIRNLLINQPPATTKSMTASVCFPAWVWARDATRRFMCLSYDQRLATRDALRTRMLVESERYQAIWPVRLSDDQNTKTRYNTEAGGWRMSLGLASGVVGEHPHGKIIDDPHNTKNRILTETELVAVADTFDYGLSSRGATLNAWTVLLMQRLHERDLSGHWLAHNAGDLVHLCLPMRYEPPVWVDLGAGRRVLQPRMARTPLGFEDPRREAGELLWPDEWPEEKVDAIVASHLGPWGESGQFQQRPAPAGGLLFQAEWFQLIERPPAEAISWVRYWDVAATEGGIGPRTAGVLVGRTKSGRFIIGDVVKGRWSPRGVDAIMKQTARLDGPGVRVREEVEPGSSGKAVVSARAILLAGFDYRGVPVSGRGDKTTRALPLCAQAEAGNVSIVAGHVADSARRQLARELLDEFISFPLGALKDQVDAASGAFNVLTQDDVGDYELLFSGPSASLDAEVAELEAKLGIQRVH